MQQSGSWDSVSSSTCQGIPSPLRNPNVHYRVQKTSNERYPEPVESNPQRISHLVIHVNEPVLLNFLTFRFKDPFKPIYLWHFVLIYYSEGLLPHAQTLSWSTTLCRLSATVYSACLQLPCVSRPPPPPQPQPEGATCGKVRVRWKRCARKTCESVQHVTVTYMWNTNFGGLWTSRKNVISGHGMFHPAF
jgi:hypothetical protein